MDVLYIGLIVFILAALAGVAVYIYRFVKRIGRNLKITIENKWAKLGIALLGIAIFAFCMSIFGMLGFVVLLHLVAISMVVDVINIIIKKIKKEKYSSLKIWSKIYKSCVIPLVVTVAIMS